MSTKRKANNNLKNSSGKAAKTNVSFTKSELSKRALQQAFSGNTQNVGLWNLHEFFRENKNSGAPAALPPNNPTEEAAALPPNNPTEEAAALPPSDPTEEAAALPPNDPTEEAQSSRFGGRRKSKKGSKRRSQKKGGKRHTSKKTRNH